VVHFRDFLAVLSASNPRALRHSPPQTAPRSFITISRSLTSLIFGTFAPLFDPKET